MRGCFGSAKVIDCLIDVRVKHDAVIKYRELCLHSGDEQGVVEKGVESSRRRGGGFVRGRGAMFRVRATAFFTGFAVASGIAMFQLQRDMWGSHRILADEVEGYYNQLEKRIQQLERAVGVATPTPHRAGGEECD